MFEGTSVDALEGVGTRRAEESAKTHEVHVVVKYGMRCMENFTNAHEGVGNIQEAAANHQEKPQSLQVVSFGIRPLGPVRILQRVTLYEVKCVDAFETAGARRAEEAAATCHGQDRRTQCMGENSMMLPDNLLSCYQATETRKRITL